MSTCGKWSHNYIGGVCLNGCGIPQNKPRIPERKPDPKLDYVHGIVDKYLPKLRWETETLEGDTRVFWVAVHKLNKNKPTLLRETIEWAAKQGLHPRQFVKAVNTICRTSQKTDT